MFSIVLRLRTTGPFSISGVWVLGFDSEGVERNLDILKHTGGNTLTVNPKP